MSADRAPRLALGALAALAIVAVCAPLVSPFPPEAVDLASRRLAPNATHWFGTDDLGRDVLARVLAGARVSLAIGLASAALSVALGTALGAVAGFVRGALEAVLMRVADALLAMPRLPLLMIVGAIARPDVPTIIGMVAAIGWMECARLVRAETLALREREFIEAAVTVGTNRSAIIVRHLLPNVAHTVAVAATLAVGRSILLESSLSFFGVGVQPPQPSWGNMLYQAQAAMASEPWIALFPGLAIFLTVLGVNAVGEALSERPSVR
jgi:peptide/nickel transport system permease protein